MPRITKVAALKVSLLAIVSVILVEGVAGYLTGSLALLSDSAHAAFDALSTLILLLATTLSLKPADEDHTYGHGKIESLGALIGGMFLLVLVTAIAVLAVLRLHAGDGVHPSLLGYAAAGYTMGIDILRMSILTIALRTGSQTVKADLYHAMSDFGSTTLVFVALGLTALGYTVGDTAVSMILAAVLGFLSLRLMYASSLDLSDAISGKLVQSILRKINQTDEVLKCKELRVRRVGDITYVDAVIGITPDVALVDADTIASRTEANLSKLLGKSSIMIHLEPLDWQVPVDVQIRHAASKVEGAREVHNLSVTNIEERQYVTLHVQVDPSLPLDKAHKIAEAVEGSIEKAVPSVRQVTVHLEPSMPLTKSGMLVGDQEISDVIRSIVETYRGVVEINSIVTYSTGDELRVNINCVFEGDEAITNIHEMVSKIENRIRQKFKKAIVTIHPEPKSSYPKESQTNNPRRVESSRQRTRS